MSRAHSGPRVARLLAFCSTGVVGCAVSEQAELLDPEPAASGAASSGGGAGSLSMAGSRAGISSAQGGVASAGSAGHGAASSMAGSFTPIGGGVAASGANGAAGSPAAGSSGVAGGGASPGACTPGATLVGAPINDTEALNAQGNDYIQMTSSGWFLYFDQAHTGTVTPSASMPQLGVVAGNGGNVFRVAGTTLAVDFWGAGAGLWVNPCIDTTALTGVKFWLRSDRPVIVAAMTPATTPVSGGGSCNEPCVANAATPVAAKPQGEVVMLPLSSFVGGSAPLDRAKVTGLIFTINAPGGAAWSFDVQLDDLGVY